MRKVIKGKVYDTSKSKLIMSYLYYDSFNGDNIPIYLDLFQKRNGEKYFWEYDPDIFDDEIYPEGTKEYEYSMTRQKSIIRVGEGYKPGKTTCISIEPELLELGKKRARRQNISFSVYVSNLIVADDDFNDTQA